MTRKTLLTVVLAITALTATAGIYEGDWYKFPVFSDTVDDILLTSDKVYYLSGSELFSYRPADSESYHYNLLNKLSDHTIERIFQNHDKGYLLLAYDNGNIDLLYDNGRVVNLPEIKDASLSASKKINDVAFSGDRVVVATDFGIVVYDDVKGEVIESGIYNAPIHCVEIMNGHLLIYGDICTGFQLMAAPLEVRHNNLDKFVKMGGCNIRELISLDDNHILQRERDSRQLCIRRLDFVNHTNTNVVPYSDKITVTSPVRRYKDGLYATADQGLVTVNGHDITLRPMSGDLAGNKLALGEDPARVWAGDSRGIALYDISGDPKPLTGRAIHPGTTTDRRVGYMRWSPDGQRLYISNMENSISRTYAKGEGSQNYQTTNIISDGQATDVSLMQASATHKYSTEYQAKYGNTRMYGDPTWILEDPDDPEKYYCGNYFEGLYVIKKNPETGRYEEIGKFTSDNSTITDNWGQRVLNVTTDREGNLWVGHQFGGILSVLPAAKRRLDPSAVTQADWKTYTSLSPDYTQKDLMLLLCRKSDMLFYSVSKYEKGFAAVDTKGTYTNPADDNVHYWNKVTDQDGNELTYSYITYIVEDNRGCVWIGTNAGVFEITNPANATNPAMTVRHIKVPRNDGTNYADYLLESEFINWIAIDPSDRKWIATENSGLYLVSETGDRIIRHYDSTNSPLPSNSVWSVECDTRDNTVYVGTSNGLYTFKSDSSQPHQDYSEIYAYPNPVRPEYSGLVTITGLMDNSVVKIADAAGNVVSETRSEGGMATWDACGPDGERVRSGVYYVYASANNSGTSSGAVTKILVIN